MNDYEMAKCAVQAQDTMGGGVMAGSALQNATISKQQPLNVKLQDLNKRAASVGSMLATLLNAVMPPQPLAGTGLGNDLKDSTLSGEIDDLHRTISQIEKQVTRLSVAITGAA